METPKGESFIKEYFLKYTNLRVSHLASIRNKGKKNEETMFQVVQRKNSNNEY